VCGVGVECTRHESECVGHVWRMGYHFDIMNGTVVETVT
jgi:hypothetical protein